MRRCIPAAVVFAILAPLAALAACPVPVQDGIALELPASAQVGQQIDAAVTYQANNTSEQIGAVQFTLAYDTSRLQYIGAVLGSGSPSTFAVTNQLDVPAGKLVQIIGNGLDGMPAGSHEVARVRFLALAAGPAAVQFVTQGHPAYTHASTVSLCSVLSIASGKWPARLIATSGAVTIEQPSQRGRQRRGVGIAAEQRTWSTIREMYR